MDEFHREMIEGFARLDTKLDVFIESHKDHETRIRVIESDQTQCKNDDRVDDIEKDVKKINNKVYWLTGAAATIGPTAALLLKDILPGA